MLTVYNVTPLKGERVTFIEERNIFERYGADCWYERMGESTEPVYEAVLLEIAYQQFKVKEKAERKARKNG